MSTPDPPAPEPQASSWSLPEFSPGALLFAGVRFFGVIAFLLMMWHSGKLGAKIEALVHGAANGIISSVEKPRDVEQKFLNSSTGEYDTRTVVGVRNIKVMLNQNFYFGLCLAIAAAFLVRVKGAPDAITRVLAACLILLPCFILASVLHAYYVYDLRAASVDGMTYTRGVHETFLFTTLTFLAIPLFVGSAATYSGRWITPKIALMRARRRGKRKSK